MKRLTCTILTLLAAMSLAADDAADRLDAVRVAALTYGENIKTDCFSDAFLAEVDRRSTLRVHRKLDQVALDSESLFNAPMVVMAGRKAFALTTPQRRNLRAYLQRGGFLLAGAACADQPWDGSFRATIEQLLPDAQFKPLPADHALMTTLFSIDRVQTAWPTEHPLWGVHINGRLAVLYSPAGLNDSADLGTECCCCGANEVRNARQINANALVYAVTR